MLQRYLRVGVSRIGQKYIQDVRRRDPEARCVLAGMTAKAGCGKQLAIDKQPHAPLRVKQQSHHGYRAGSYVKELPHMLRIRKRQPRGTDLLGQILCTERLIARHEQQIERRFLCVGKKQILTHLRAEQTVDIFAVRDRRRGRVIDARKRDMQALKGLIYKALRFAPFEKPVRRAGIQGLIYEKLVLRFHIFFETSPWPSLYPPA